MRVLLDDELCEVDRESIGEAIAAVAARVREQGRLIVEVHVDGEQWTSEQLDAEELVGGSADEVRLTSAEPRELAGKVFADAGDALTLAETHQNHAAEMLQSGRTVEGLREFNEALSIWVSVQQAVEQAAVVAEIDLEESRNGGRSAAEVLIALSGRLKHVRDRLRSQDLVGVADSLLYDLPEILSEWREVLGRLAREAGGN